MLSRLKYAGIPREDLLLIYKLFIRSTAEYCSVVFHSALTQEQTKKIELIQSTSLKIILGCEYLNYESALKICSLDTLYQRRSDRMLNFAIKCTQDKFNKKLFPLNVNPKNKDHFLVNFARTNKYLNSTVPQCQRLLNLAVRRNPKMLTWENLRNQWHDSTFGKFGPPYLPHINVIITYILIYLMWMVIPRGSYHLHLNK